MGQYAFAIDAASCTGCKTCQVACQEAHDLDAAILWRQVLQYGGGSWKEAGAGVYAPEGVFRYFVSVSCNHCAHPVCVENCPTGAMAKDPDTGIVTSDPSVCIGCETCVEACPYDAPKLNPETSVIGKCDMCSLLIEAGEEPACVQACPTRAMHFGTLEELKGAYPEADALIEPLPLAETDPSLLVLPHASAQRSGEGTGEVIFCTAEV